MNDLQTRRRFLLKSLAWAAGTGCLYGTNTAARAEGRPGARKARIVVLGAGLAGLAAALELKSRGHEVTVLEARQRPGGRVFTLRKPFDSGFYAEAGAARIWDVHELTRKYVRRYKLPLVPFYPPAVYGQTAVAFRGQVLPASKFTAWARKHLALRPDELANDGFDLYLKPVLSRLEGSDAKTKQALLAPYESLSWRQFLKRQGASPDAIELIAFGESQSDLDETSAACVLDSTARFLSARTLFKIPGGSDRLPQAMAAELRENILYGAEVLELRRQAQAAVVCFARSGLRQAIHCDYIICALPFSVLKGISVRPPFCQEKQKLIRDCAYESASRVVLQTKSRFWLGQELSGFALTDWPDEIWNPCYEVPGRHGLLSSYTEGARSRQLSQLSEHQQVEVTRRHLDSVFKGVADQVMEATSVCWDNERYSRGAHLTYHPGKSLCSVEAMSSPEGRVHFAGEHTSAWPGWMEGALQSGLRAAAEIEQACTVSGA